MTKGMSPIHQPIKIIKFQFFRSDFGAWQVIFEFVRMDSGFYQANLL